MNSDPSVLAASQPDPAVTAATVPDPVAAATVADPVTAAATADAPVFQLTPEQLALLGQTVITPPAPFRVRSSNYVDQDGRSITALEDAKGTPPADLCRYVAHGEVKLKAKVPSKTGGPAEIREQSIPVNVPLPQAISLDNAFELFDAAVQAEGQKMVEQFRQQHIRAQLAASAGPGIITPR